jgi:hypothetical protein
MAQIKYREFLAQFFTENPGMFEGWMDHYDGNEESNEELRQELLEITGNWTNWTLRYKSRPGKGEYELGVREPYMIHKTGIVLNRYGEPVDGSNSWEKRPKTDFVWERAFDCEGSDGQIAYVVLEDKEGNLYLGEYIGD